MTRKSVPGPARSGQMARLLESDDPMQDTDAPLRRNEADDAEATPDEASMRLALERLGTRSSPGHRATGSRASDAVAGARATPRPRPRFVRDGDVPVVRVPVVRVPAAARLPGEAGRELAEERAACLRAEEALADAQGTISRLQVARSRAEQALQAAQAAVEEREAAMAGLRAELARAAQREAALAEAARVGAEKAQAAVRPRPAPAPSREPEPVRWWLDYLKAPRS
jgi:hypothetical protein